MQQQLPQKTGLTQAIRAAFWSGVMPVKKWRQAMKQPPSSHKFIFKSSFAHMPVDVIIPEMGEKRFLKGWPEIRKLFDPGDARDRQRLLLFDSTWGILATGDSQYPVSEKVAALSRGQLLLLREAIDSPGLLVHDLANRVARSYSRVLKDVQLLADQGLVDIEAGTADDPKACRIYPRESINTRLARARKPA